MREVFSRNQMQSRLDECKAVELWPRIVGEAIAGECKKPFVKGGTMFVATSNASLRNELSMSRSLIRKEINSLLGKEIIKDINFVT